jgi:hypothetical protein
MKQGLTNPGTPKRNKKAGNKTAQTLRAQAV